ncbi:hypothetical protein M407DRAFT_244488 [Tulasnella calospora MUT 4182]|uniref:Uncharacterized protein n=1 Tax=Tulasnella calospora MUT 4182 TaxID=1051891 RepID=A0A0C3QG17_9AGAM|nr:hypothetical protein M407DRAFT_244488 [Tulasnella calospora MUT 4182]
MAVKAYCKRGISRTQLRSSPGRSAILALPKRHLSTSYIRTLQVTSLDHSFHPLIRLHEKLRLTSLSRRILATFADDAVFTNRSTN